MRKFLSILTAVTLTATTATTVVACGTKEYANNPSVNYSEFKTWIDDSNKNADNTIIFIGGRTESRSLSYLAGRQTLLGDNVDGHLNYDIEHLTDKEHIQEMDAKMSEFGDIKINKSKSNDNDLKNMLQNKLSGSTEGIGNIGINDGVGTTQYEGFAKELYKVKDENFARSYSFHSILVDDLKGFWANGLGEEIVSKYFKDESINGSKKYRESFYTEDSKKQQLTDKEAKKLWKLKKEQISIPLSNLDGPIFLIIRSGHLVGITSGYTNYYEFSTKIDDKDKAKYSQKNFKQVLDDYEKLLDFANTFYVSQRDYFERNLNLVDEGSASSPVDSLSKAFDKLENKDSEDPIDPEHLPHSEDDNKNDEDPEKDDENNSSEEDQNNNTDDKDKSFSYKIDLNKFI